MKKFLKVLGSIFAWWLLYNTVFNLIQFAIKYASGSLGLTVEGQILWSIISAICLYIWWKLK